VLTSQACALVAVALVLDLVLGAGLFQLLERLHRLLRLVAVVPGVGPVGALGRVLEDVDHGLGRVDALGDLGAVALEVGRQLVNRAEVSDPAAALEQEDIVELLEETRRRLVDCAENGLAALDELLEERDNDERRLAVEARGRLVEKEDRWLGDKLNRNRQPLALLDAKAGAGDADDSVLDVVQFEQLD
jgi:hypothetical protein